jgi:hypothetical protein
MAYTGVFPNEVGVYIVASGTNGSALTAANKVAGEITNVKVSGLEQPKDMVPVIGGMVDKRTPRTIGEISFDVIANNTATSTIDRWLTYKFPTGVSTDVTVQKAVFISALSNGTNWTLACNNADVTVGDTELAADDMMKFSVTMKFSAQTTTGSANLRTSSLAYSNSFFNW